ncbi:hypothetical protein [Arsenicibacter rosenii]|uniref:TonB-dependent receptor plug domain-containing protein n=1 Tax=Arsenicibacter rosenii TaxID=1750698 RepID=A0A1S2VN38_9BACT|nr:hypothetical protein [Arsenicibacter rosenii]OIN60183.1 hypothetical protein BLX24_04935 [Arsenicibacter rosenii]
MKRIILAVILAGSAGGIEAVEAHPVRPMRGDTAMPVENRRLPRPAIIPGAGLDTTMSRLPAQDQAIHDVVPDWLRSRNASRPLYIIDGKVASVSQMKALRADDVVSVNQMDGRRALTTYGSNARNGLVMITTRKGM